MTWQRKAETGNGVARKEWKSRFLRDLMDDVWYTWMVLIRRKISNSVCGSQYVWWPGLLGLSGRIITLPDEFLRKLSHNNATTPSPSPKLGI